MGYFSNGTEGLDYVEHYCRRCIHWKDLNDGRGEGCPIWDMHLLFAYEECDSGSNAETMLNTLIPRGFIEDAGDGVGMPTNEECTMFHPRDAGAMIPGQLTLE